MAAKIEMAILEEKAGQTPPTVQTQVVPEIQMQNQQRGGGGFRGRQSGRGGDISKGVINQEQGDSKMMDVTYVVSYLTGPESVRSTRHNISNKHQTTALHTVTPGEVSMTTTEAGGLRDVKKEQRKLRGPDHQVIHLQPRRES
ncbi:hypothetical protein NQZ68_031460 [Dissostichus eleginoides]|nr:hypothetical protein NQZ68_031460 [Dissostichus eleginoides]